MPARGRPYQQIKIPGGPDALDGWVVQKPTDGSFLTVLQLRQSPEANTVTPAKVMESPKGVRYRVPARGKLVEMRTSFGGGHQRTDVPMLIDMFMSGKYKLKELISRRVPLTDVNLAFDALLKGEVKRSVVVY